MAAGSAVPGGALSAAAAAVRRRWPTTPRVGLILGSGLGDLAAAVEMAEAIPFAQIPGHPLPTVEGHVGQLVVGVWAGTPVAIWSGRTHFYEGRSMIEIGFPIRLLRKLGADILLLTNAAGGLNQNFATGDLMMLRDHINLPGLAGHSPLRGAHDPDHGKRFVDLADAYDPELRRLAHDVASEQGGVLREGVYAMVAGPSYETPAEARLLRLLGADAVGMSTAPEVVVARQVGLRVLAISAITNMLLAPGEAAGVSHAEVLAASQQIKPRFAALLNGVVGRVATQAGLSP